jgi:isoquinoline 1-oxidoreductase subunit alpha
MLFLRPGFTDRSLVPPRVGYGHSHPVQKAWLAERVPQCGYCQSGQIMSAVDLLKRKPHPTRAEIVEQMSGHICRCGTYPRILRAIERASREG